MITETGCVRAQTGDLPESDQAWNKHRKDAEDIEYIYFTGNNELFINYAQRMYVCSEFLEYGYKTDEENAQVYKFARASFCKVRHCPVCQWRRQMKWQARFFDAVPQIQQLYPTHRWLFLTLTIQNPNTDKTRDAIKQLNASFVKLTKLKNWPAIGWIKSIEVTEGEQENKSHPHLHALLLVPAGYFTRRYIKHEEWVHLWKKCLRVDYDPIVNVKAVKGDVSAAIVETLKYAVKPSEAISNPDWFREITVQLFKTRAVSIGGCLRSIINPKSEPEPEDENDEDIVTKDIYAWERDIKRYKHFKTE